MIAMRRVPIALALFASGCQIIFPLRDPPGDAKPTGDAKETDANDATDGPMLPPKFVFVTSMTFGGDLGGLAGADAKCANAWAVTGLRGQFKAWLSDPSGNANSRMSGVGAFYRVDNTKVADDFTDLTDGTLAARIDIDENGDPAVVTTACNGNAVWTGTGEGGLVSSDHCDSWSNNGFTGTAGSTNSTTSWSTGCSNVSCSERLPLYCIEQ